MFIKLFLINYFIWSIAGKMNILLIVVDDLRPTLGCYEDVKAYTPNIDDLAEKSIVFTKAFAQQSLCAPSRNSFLTSRRPDTLQLYDFYSYWRDSVGNFTTLPEHLKNNDYTTMPVGKVFHPGKDQSAQPEKYQRNSIYFVYAYPGISSNGSDDCPYSWSEKPFHPYTNRYKDVPVCRTTVNSLPAANLICPVCVPCMPNETLPDIETLNAAQTFIHEHRKDQNPFFLAVGFQKPHIPLKYPQQYLKYHPLNKFTLPDPYAWPANISNVVYNPWTDIRKREDVKALLLKFPWEKVPPTFAKLIVQSYYAAVTYVDDLIGMLMDQLCISKIKEDTIVILTSDHGWSLGEHAEWAKYSNFDVALHVPLIVSIPGLTYDSSCSSKTANNKCSTCKQNEESAIKKTPTKRSYIQEHKNIENLLRKFHVVSKKIENENNKRFFKFNGIQKSSDNWNSMASKLKSLDIETIGKITTYDNAKNSNRKQLTAHFLQNFNEAKDNFVNESFKGNKSRKIESFNSGSTESPVITEMGKEQTISTPFDRKSTMQLSGEQKLINDCDTKDNLSGIQNATENLEMLLRQIEAIMRSERENSKEGPLYYKVRDKINDTSNINQEVIIRERNNSASSQYLVRNVEKIEALVKRFEAILRSIEISMSEPALSKFPGKRKMCATSHNILEYTVTGPDALRVKQTKILPKTIDIDNAENERFAKSNIKNVKENLLCNADRETINDFQWKKEIGPLRSSEKGSPHRIKNDKKNYPYKVTSNLIGNSFREKWLERLRTLQANFDAKDKEHESTTNRKTVSSARSLDINFERTKIQPKSHGKSFFTHRVENVATLNLMKDLIKDHSKRRKTTTIKNNNAEQRYSTRKRRYITVNSMVELVDIFPTIAELAGFPIPICPDIEDRSVPREAPTFPNPCSEGVTLLPLITAAVSHKTLPWKKAAFSQYPRPDVDPTLSPNSDKPRLNEINIMGYTMRTNKYRYTAWVPFAHSSRKPDWSTIIADELYDHGLEDGENINEANSLAFLKVKEQLRAQLKHGWRQALPDWFKS